jgi:hypothetical protein
MSNESMTETHPCVDDSHRVNFAADAYDIRLISRWRNLDYPSARSKHLIEYLSTSLANHRAISSIEYHRGIIPIG